MYCFNTLKLLKSCTMYHLHNAAHWCWESVAKGILGKEKYPAAGYGKPEMTATDKITPGMNSKSISGGFIPMSKCFSLYYFFNCPPSGPFWSGVSSVSSGLHFPAAVAIQRSVMRCPGLDWEENSALAIFSWTGPPLATRVRHESTESVTDRPTDWQPRPKGRDLGPLLCVWLGQS